MPSQSRPSVPPSRVRGGEPSSGTAAMVAAALALAGTLGCNALFDIEEATLCDGDACAMSRASPDVPTGSGRFDAERLNASAPDAGVPSGAAAPSASSVAPDPPLVCATPAPELARDCASCGGSVACDGRCDVAVPPNLGAACGSCGGTIDCRGGCSVATPSDYGSILPRDMQASFSCCLIDEVRSYGPDGPDSSGCYPGYVYDGCAVSKTSGYGSVSIVEEDAESCTCRVHVQNQGLDGAAYTVSIRLKRACQPD